MRGCALLGHSCPHRLNTIDASVPLSILCSNDRQKPGLLSTKMSLTHRRKINCRKRAVGVPFYEWSNLIRAELRSLRPAHGEDDDEVARPFSSSRPASRLCQDGSFSSSTGSPHSQLDWNKQLPSRLFETEMFESTFLVECKT